MAISALAVAAVAVGVIVVGATVFDRLMAEHGATLADSYAMFDRSVRLVVIGASAVAIAGSIGLALAFGRAVGRPLRELAEAARRVAMGGYDARVRRPGTSELASVADSFNLMAASLQDQERQRRELILNFGHELRTPLTNLHGYLAGLREGVFAPTAEVFASLQDEVARLRRLSHSLDALAAGVDPKRVAEELDLVPIINAIVELRRPQLSRAQISIEIELPARLPALADPDAVAQVVGNLLQNAGVYTPAGGTVWIRAEQEPDSTLVSVANTGPGIPPSDLPHVFERFYRVDKSRSPSGGGAGIGLAIVKQLVEAVGGQVGAESGAGTTRFWFRLPA